MAGRRWVWLLFVVMGILATSYVRTANQSGWNFQAATMQGRRFYQEDRLLTVSSVEGAISKVGLFAVFDGHGGSQASEFAVNNFYPKFVGHLKNTSSPDQATRLQDALRLAIADVEDGYMEVAHEQALIAGSTAVVAAVTSDSVVVANVGDSRAFLCQEGVDLGQRRVVPLTVDHHPEVPAERARVESMGGVVVNIGGYSRVNGILAMSRAIGDKDLKPYGVSAEPEFQVWSRSKDDFAGGSCVLVVASDGVFEELLPQQVCKVVLDADKQNDEKVAVRVLRKAFNSGSNDNLSLILVDLQQ